MPSEQYQDYEDEAVWHCKRAKVQRPIEEPVEVKCLFYMPTRRGIIVSHDGSRVLYDKDNPRTEVFISEMEDVDATT